MGMPFIVSSPEITHQRQSEFVLIGGNSETQILGNYTSKNWKMFWATELQVNAKVVEIQAAGWILDGEPGMTPIYPPLDCYNCEIHAHKHTAL